MTAATHWTHSIDGVALNDFTSFACSVPEVMNVFGPEVLMTDMQARTPVFNRQQPMPGRYTFLITPIARSDADYQARLATLRGLVGPGIHTWVWQAPGESSSHTLSVYFDGGLVVDDSMYGRVTSKAVAPDPLFA
jgi:hypothetical protein